MAEPQQNRALTELFGAVDGMNLQDNVEGEHQETSAQSSPSQPQAEASSQSQEHARAPKRRVPQDRDAVSERIDLPGAAAERRQPRPVSIRQSIEGEAVAPRPAWLTSTPSISTSSQYPLKRRVPTLEPVEETEELDDISDRPRQRRRLDLEEEESTDDRRVRRHEQSPSPSPKRRTRPGGPISREQDAQDLAASIRAPKIKRTLQDRRKADAAKSSNRRTFERETAVRRTRQTMSAFADRTQKPDQAYEAADESGDAVMPVLDPRIAEAINQLRQTRFDFDFDARRSNSEMPRPSRPVEFTSSRSSRPEPVNPYAAVQSPDYNPYEVLEENEDIQATEATEATQGNQIVQDTPVAQEEKPYIPWAEDPEGFFVPDWHELEYRQLQVDESGARADGSVDRDPENASSNHQNATQRNGPGNGWGDDEDNMWLREQDISRSGVRVNKIGDRDILQQEDVAFEELHFSEMLDTFSGLEVIEEQLHDIVEDGVIRPMESMEDTETDQQDLVQAASNQQKEEVSFRYQNPAPHPWLSIRNQPTNPRYTALLQDFKQEVSRRHWSDATIRS
jgi:hypothetical protein